MVAASKGVARTFQTKSTLEYRACICGTGSDFIGICTVIDGQIVSDSSEDLSKFRSENPPKGATEDEIDQFWEDWHDKDISEKFTGVCGRDIQ